MKITAVTPPDAASSPAHPDHDRWVKEKTLAMEVEHAKRVGLPLRVAEAENIRLLERSEQIAKGAKSPLSKRKNPPAITPSRHQQRKAERGVTVRYAKPEKLTGARLSPCGRCGLCKRCKAEKRVALMSLKAKQGDLKYVVVLWRLGMFAQQAQDGTGRFAGVSPRDANRQVQRIVEEVCDATIPTMGPWR